MTYRPRQEAVLIAETSTEQERLTGARGPVVEPRRLVVRLTAEAVVGVQVTVSERHVRRDEWQLCRLSTSYRYTTTTVRIKGSDENARG